LLQKGVHYCKLSKTRRCGNVTFLSPNKKVTKEVGWGECVEAKSIDAASINQHYYLDSEPLKLRYDCHRQSLNSRFAARSATPRTPLPAWSKAFLYSFSSYNRYLTIRASGSWYLVMYDIPKSYPSAKNRNIFCGTGSRLRCSRAVVSARRDGYIGKGGAPRSESIIAMIANGNHSTIHRL